MLGVEDRLDAFDLAARLRKDVTVLVENAAQRIDKFGPLVDEPLAGAEQNGSGLLLFGAFSFSAPSNWRFHRPRRRQRTPAGPA